MDQTADTRQTFSSKNNAFSCKFLNFKARFWVREEKRKEKKRKEKKRKEKKRKEKKKKKKKERRSRRQKQVSFHNRTHRTFLLIACVETPHSDLAVESTAHRCAMLEIPVTESYILGG